jgi:hypothetical protein
MGSPTVNATNVTRLQRVAYGQTSSTRTYCKRAQQARSRNWRPEQTAKDRWMLTAWKGKGNTIALDNWPSPARPCPLQLVSRMIFTRATTTESKTCIESIRASELEPLVEQSPEDHLCPKKKECHPRDWGVTMSPRCLRTCRGSDEFQYRRCHSRHET